jgi:hypothetical protein
MSKNPHDQEEHYYVVLRKFLRFAEYQKYKSEKAEGWEEKLGIRKAVKDVINELHGIILEIDTHGMFNGRIKEMCLKVIKLLTDIMKSEGRNFSNGVIFN